ncbi:hypothetical protein VQ044_24690 [Aurantimonas sp. C2-5-R2]
MAIVAGDLPVHLGPIRNGGGRLDPFAFDTTCLDTMCLDALRGCADLALRLKPDALCFKAAMIDARVDIEFGQPFIGEFRPTLPPALHHLGSIPVADLPAKAVLVPIYLNLAHGEHDMGMGLGHSVLADVPMHIEVGDHALIDEFRLREVAGEFVNNDDCSIDTSPVSDPPATQPTSTSYANPAICLAFKGGTHGETYYCEFRRCRSRAGGACRNGRRGGADGRDRARHAKRDR